MGVLAWFGLGGRLSAASAKSGGGGAKSKLPPLPDPKVRSKPAAQPSHIARSGQQDGPRTLQERDRQVATADLLNLRNAGNTKGVIRSFAATTPDLSSSLNAYIRMVVTPGFTCIARNQDSTASSAATAAVMQVLNRFNYLGDYSNGFSGTESIHAVAESFTKELRIYGACCGELVLDKALLPSRIQPISTSQIKFVDDGKSAAAYPVQDTGQGGEGINLNIPAFFYESLDQDLLDAYSSSPMEAAVQAVIGGVEFENDVRRVIKRALHPRLLGVIDTDKFLRALPPEVQGDPEKLKKYMDGYISGVASSVNDLDPQDALITFNDIAFEYLSRGNESLSQEYNTLQTQIDSKIASGAKVPGAVLGHSVGSQNVASTESMLFVKYATGTQIKVNSILSRMLTLAVRLMGYDCYVEFAFEKINLRPKTELEGFAQMEQERILTQLSLGMISDDEACIALTGRLPPDGAPKLSGTFFKTGGAPSVGNPYSNTSAGAVAQDMNPGTPQNIKGGG